MYLAGTANLVNVTTTGDVTLTGAANNVCLMPVIMH